MKYWIEYEFDDWHQPNYWNVFTSSDRDPCILVAKCNTKEWAGRIMDLLVMADLELNGVMPR